MYIYTQVAQTSGAIFLIKENQLRPPNKIYSRVTLMNSETLSSAVGHRNETRELCLHAVNVIIHFWYDNFKLKMSLLS